MNKVTFSLQAVCALVVLAAQPWTSSANSVGFVLEQVVPIAVDGAGPHGLAVAGDRWYIANTTTAQVSVHDLNFNRVGQFVVPGIADARGLVYDPTDGTLFVGDLTTTVVRHVSLTGTILGQFTGNGAADLNALAYDSVSDSLWLAYFSGGKIENRTKQGALLATFSDPTYQWTGLAVDAVRRTLLALETDDQLIEYELDGTKLGLALGDDPAGNGQGLAYNAGTGRLYVTSQIGDVVSIYRDASRVPEPGSGPLLVAAIAASLSSRLRRGKN